MTASSAAKLAAFSDVAMADRPAKCSAALRRLVLFNVKYSPNLGDGLLSECLEQELQRSLPGCDVVSIDLAGRSSYPSSHNATRGLALALLDRCPAGMRKVAARVMLEILLAARLRRHYRAGLTGAQAVVVGGGNLLTDADLNFPMKVAGALAQAAKASLPVVVYGVGVAPHWSVEGTRMFTNALAGARVAWASVRDHRSQTSWNAHFADKGIPAANVVVDPGILASLHYPCAPRSSSGRKVGFCVTDPLAVRYHSDASAAATLDDWYPAALRSLVERGFEVALFTNGSPEDRDYLHSRFNTWIRYAKGPVTLDRSFENPGDLAFLVSGCDAVVGHRMHACIAAHSFGVPTVGLRWDVKLDSFFDLAARSAHLLDPAVVAPSELGDRTLAAIADRPDPAPLIARARQEIAAFAALVQNLGVADRP